MILFVLQIGILAYLIGAIPAALLIVKRASGKDLRKEGSGNIGALNGYEVSGKKYIGIATFFADFLKGIIAVKLALILSGNNFLIACIAAFFAVLGHNYSVYIKFKGGRGLATAVGVFSLLNPFIIFIWLIMWGVGFYVIKKHVHVGNIFASLISPILVYTAPTRILDLTLTAEYYFVDEYRLAVALICFIILTKHFSVIPELFQNKK